MGKNIIILFALACLLSMANCSGGSSSSAPSPPSPPLVWDAPAAKTDGSPLTDLAGYRIYYGTVSGVYTGYIDVPGNVTQYAIADLSSVVPVRGRTYFLAVTAFDSDDYESEASGETTRSIN